MAETVKGITIKFEGDTVGLSNALKKINKESAVASNKLRAIDRALKFNPRNVELLEQKQKALTDRVNETKAAGERLKQVQAELIRQNVDENSAEYQSVRRQIIETESKVKHFEAELKRFGSVGKQQALAVANAMKTAGGKIKSAGRNITTTVSVWGMAAFYAGGKAIEAAEKQVLAEDKLKSIYKDRMHATDEAAQATLDLAAAMQEEGVIGDEVTLAGAQQLATYAKYPETINKLLPAMDNWLAQEKGMSATQEDAEAKAKILGKALNGNVGALSRLGISLTDAQQEILKTGTEEEKAALISEVLESKFGDVNNELAKTDSGKIQQAKNAIGDMTEEIGIALLPVVADLVSWVQDKLLPKIQAFIDFMQQHPNITKFALAIAGIIAVAGPLLMFIGSLIGLVGSLAAVATALDVALLPVIGVVAAIVAGIAAAVAIGVLLYKNWDKIKELAVSLKDKIAETWLNIKTAIFNAIKPIVQKTIGEFGLLKARATAIFAAIKNAITHPIETAKNIIKKIIEKIKGFFSFKVPKPHIPLPHFSIKPSGWKLSDLLKGKIPSLGIKWYAQGGIFNGPTVAGIGEAGPEAVVPLTKLWEKLDAIAENSGTPVVVNVYGSDNMSISELASAVEQKLIQMQKRKAAAWA